MREKINKKSSNAMIQSIIGSNAKSQTAPKPSIAESKKASTSL